MISIRSDSQPTTLEIKDDHYLKAATELGDSQSVIAREAIYASNGMKLVERGVRIDSRLYDRLLAHKLRAPIDDNLTAENTVSRDDLCGASERLIAERAFYARLVAKSADRAVIQDAIRSIALPKPIAFRLTVAHGRRRDVFDHSMQVCLVALHLGVRQGLVMADLRSLAAAGLLHDIGVLHIDPEMLRPGHKFAAAELRLLQAHPLTATMIVRQRSEYPPVVARAILEHHERHDGTGYPRGLRGDEISVVGRILLLAEVVAAVLDKKIRAPWERVSLILRLNHFKFDGEMAQDVLKLLEGEPVEPTDPADTAHHSERLERLIETFRNWTRARSELHGYASGSPAVVAFLTGRIAALERALADAGFHPDQLASAVDGIHEQPGAAGELGLLAREAGWQLNEIIQDVFRRFPTLETTDDPGERAICDWLYGLKERLEQGISD